MISLNLDNPQLAQTYDAISDSQFDSGRRLFGLLEVPAGASVLDLGCGTGRLGFWVAEQIGATGKVIGYDPLPERIAVASEKNRHKNAEFHVGSAEDLSRIPDSSIDVVYLSSVFHWVEHKSKALREIHRVLKAGGKVGLTTNAKELAPITTLASVSARVFSREPYRSHVDPYDFAPMRFGVTTTELIKLFIDAGLKVDSVQVQGIRRTFKSGKTVVDFAESSMFGNYTGRLPEALRPQARIDLEAEFEGIRTSEGVTNQLYTVFAVARKEGCACSCSCGSKKN